MKRVADIDEHLARQGVAVLGDDRNDAGVQQGNDDDVPDRNGAELSCRGAVAEGLGEIGGLGFVAADDLDGRPTAPLPPTCRWHGPCSRVPMMLMQVHL